MKKQSGIFISMEGCEGCGKSTHSNLLKQHLESRRFKVLLTREPGGTAVAEQVRNILLNPDSKLSALTELMLYESARSQHVEEIIKPHLEKGYIVICDRFIDSTTAYQGYGRKINIQIINKLNNIATSNIMPDLTIYLDIKPEHGIQKAKTLIKDKFTRPDNICGDRIEREDLSFHNNVRKGFLTLAKQYPKRIKKIKTMQTIDKTQNLIRDEIDKFLSGKKIYV